MRAVAVAVVLLSAVAACDELNRPMAVPGGNMNSVGGTSASSSGAPDAGSDALPELPPGPPGASGPTTPGQPPVQPQPGDVQL